MKLRNYEIDFSNPEQAARTTLQMHIDTLEACRGKTNRPDELEWEIRVYRFLLEDPVIRLKQYYDARHGEDALIEKRDAVAKLGLEESP